MSSGGPAPPPIPCPAGRASGRHFVVTTKVVASTPMVMYSVCSPEISISPSDENMLPAVSVKLSSPPSRRASRRGNTRPAGALGRGLPNEVVGPEAVVVVVAFALGIRLAEVVVATGELS